MRWCCAQIAIAEGPASLKPSLLTLTVGVTHEIQAVSATGQAMTELTWASSDTNTVSLSAADPPVLTAVTGCVLLCQAGLRG